MQAPPKTHDESARLEALYQTGLLDTPIEQRFEVITRLACRVFKTPIAAVSLVDANRLWFKSINGLDAQEIPRDISFCGHTIVHNDIFIIPDAREDIRFDRNPLVTGPPHVVFYAGCPIRSDSNSNIASLCLIDMAPRHLSDYDITSFRDLALMAQQQFAYAFQQSVTRDLLDQIETEHRRAMIDTLTRLWNRRGIEERLIIQLEQSRQNNDGIAVIVIDIDHFKNINDRFGHPVGDQVLREVAKRFVASARQSDSVGRYGGEEFLVIPGTCSGLDEAADLAERLRQHLSDSPIQTDAGPIDVTASFGITYADLQAHTTLEALISAADIALYQAKSDGRNRVRSQPIDQAAP